MLKETLLNMHDMNYIKEHLSLNKKEFDRYIINHEKHLIVTTEKLRSKITNLINFIHRAEKRFRE